MPPGGDDKRVPRHDLLFPERTATDLSEETGGRFPMEKL